MNLEREKLVEVMTFAHKDALCNADATWDEAWEAALDALIDALPDVKWKDGLKGALSSEEFHKAAQNYVYLKGLKENGIYQQLKEMKR